MKRSALILIALTAMLAFACKTDNTNGNGNRNVATNSNANQASGNDNSRQEGITAGTDKSVTITVADDPVNKGKCTIKVSPDQVHLSKRNGDKIKWCIVNTSSVGKDAIVTVGDFASSSSPGKKNPFGTGSEADNTFDIVSADYDCKVKTKDATSGDVGVGYKYTIKVRYGDNVLGMLDPQVIIDE